MIRFGTRSEKRNEKHSAAMRFTLKTAIFSNIAPIAFIYYCKIDKWSILKKEMGGTIILTGSQSGSHAQHIAPRPAGQYPDISLAPNNPWIAHPKIIIKSQDNYLLGKNSFTNFKSALNYRFYLHKGATCATFVTCATKLLVQLVHLPAASPS